MGHATKDIANNLYSIKIAICTLGAPEMLWSIFDIWINIMISIMDNPLLLLVFQLEEWLFTNGPIICSKILRKLKFIQFQTADSLLPTTTVHWQKQKC